MNCENHTGSNCKNCQDETKDLLQQFILLAYILDIAGDDIDLDEYGLEVSQFEVIDGYLHSLIDPLDLAEMKSELAGIVNKLAPLQQESTEKEN